MKKGRKVRVKRYVVLLTLNPFKKLDGTGL